jgi:hypothetical protein
VKAKDIYSSLALTDRLRYENEGTYLKWECPSYISLRLLASKYDASTIARAVLSRVMSSL